MRRARRRDRLAFLLLCAAVLLLCAAMLLNARANAASCSLDKFRLRSTGECVAKDSALGRRYYRGSRRAARVRAKPESVRREPTPGFAERFHFDGSANYRGDRLR